MIITGIFALPLSFFLAIILTMIQVTFARVLRVMSRRWTLVTPCYCASHSCFTMQGPFRVSRRRSPRVNAEAKGALIRRVCPSDARPVNLADKAGNCREYEGKTASFRLAKLRMLVPCIRARVWA